MKSTFNEDMLAGIMRQLADANADYAKHFPGEPFERQPVHTVYGGAHLFKADSAQKLGSVALRALDENAQDAIEFAQALGLPGADTLPDDGHEGGPGWLAATVYERVKEKLKREAVEDFRIDFEDGYGNRPDEEEDACAATAAMEVAKGMSEATLPPFIGIRVKPFTEELRNRATRTLDVFVSTLADQTGGKLPDNFVVTIPKVTIPEQVGALVDLFELLESNTALEPGSLKLEIMVEKPQTLFDAQGRCALPRIVAAARGRCISAHFGVYDYTASNNITAAHQSMDHPACDFARQVMKVALTDTGLTLSDGATNIMPVGPHRAAKDGPPLTAEQIEENRKVVHRAWRLCYEHMQHSLKHAYYQGWDLHPAQFCVRYAAVYTFFLSGLDDASNRLKTFVEKAAQATLIGDVFDDAATGQALLNYFLRAINCGAISEEEAQVTGLTMEELRGRSFVKILENRKS